MEHSTDLPPLDAEQRIMLRRFMTYAFRELMLYKVERVPECVSTRVWFDFDIAMEAWQRRGYQMDS